MLTAMNDRKHVTHQRTPATRWSAAHTRCGDFGLQQTFIPVPHSRHAFAVVGDMWMPPRGPMQLLTTVRHHHWG